MKRTRRDFLAWGALAAALVGTASAEYALARAAGFGEWTAACVPAALDLYAVRAMRAGRDVWAAVAAMVVTNALSHLVSARLITVEPWLVVAVSAIAPLVLWRVHRLAEHVPAPSETAVPAPAAVPDRPAVAVERVRPRPVPDVVPDGARMLPIVARPGTPPAEAEAVAAPVQLTTDGGAVEYAAVPDPIAGERRTRTRTRTAAAEGRTRTRRVSAPVDRAEGVPAPTDAELVESARTEYADDLAAGRTPSVRALRTRYRIGQDRAQRVRAALAA